MHVRPDQRGLAAAPSDGKSLSVCITRCELAASAPQLRQFLVTCIMPLCHLSKPERICEEHFPEGASERWTSEYVERSGVA